MAVGLALQQRQAPFGGEMRIEKGVADAIAAGTSTRDLGGSASTTEFTAAVIKAIGAHQN